MRRQGNERSAERGQAVIIVAFSMIVLLGICALVVDLGLSWMLRRQEQNAADPASIAAARYIEEGDSPATRDKMWKAACFYSQQNGFFDSDDEYVRPPALRAIFRFSGLRQGHMRATSPAGPRWCSWWCGIVTRASLEGCSARTPRP